MSTPPLLTDPIGHIESLTRNHSSRLLIGLAGLPGSGKSTLAVDLAKSVNERLGDGTMIALSMDGFHLTKAELKLLPNPEAALARRGAPWTFDVAALASRLALVRSSFGTTDVAWPDFQHGVGDPVSDAYVIERSIRVILVEGLYLAYTDEGWLEVSAQFDERWFLDTPQELSNERLIDRHMRTRNIDRSEAEARIKINDSLNAALTLSTRQLSDWRVE